MLEIVEIIVIAELAYLLGVWAGSKLGGSQEYVDLNELAKQITLIEGKKKNVNIAQIKEIMAITFGLMGRMKKQQINYIIEEYKVKKL